MDSFIHLTSVEPFVARWLMVRVYAPLCIALPASSHGCGGGEEEKGNKESKRRRRLEVWVSVWMQGAFVNGISK